MQTHSILTITAMGQVEVTARAAALEEIVAKEGSFHRCSELSEMGWGTGRRDQVMPLHRCPGRAQSQTRLSSPASSA